MALPKFLLPSVVGISVYIIINQFFTEKIQDDPSKNLTSDGESNLVKKIFKNKALKIAILSAFATAGIQNFQSEIQVLMVDDVFNHICIPDVDVNTEFYIARDIVQKHQLNLYSKSIKSLIISDDLTQEEKISLLKIKFDFIINGECIGKTRFLVVAILGALLAFTISGLRGLFLILEALYRLFKEGKIAKGLYKQILKVLVMRLGRKNVPIEHLRALDD